MIMKILESPWTLILVLVTGPLLVWWTMKRSKEPGKEGGKAASRRERGAPAAREEVVPGFRDVRWGESPLPAMTVVHQDADEKLYSRDGEDLMLDGAVLSSIMYSYHRDRLQAVMIDMPLGAGDRVLKGRIVKWGSPRQPNPAQARYYWMDLLSGMDATQAVLERSPSTGKSSLVISSKYIKESRDRERAAPVA
jgi:hypothetical protein